METIEAIHGRRLIRDYQPRTVQRELINLVLLDAAQAPTPPVSGDQPFVFVVIEGLERVAECGALALRYAKDIASPDTRMPCGSSLPSVIAMNRSPRE